MTTPAQHPQKIGLLGGSFNPPHRGHREISVKALDRLALDAVWWLVSPGNPLKDPAQNDPYEARMEAARKTANDNRIIISDFEEKNNLQYTVDTINALLNAYPGKYFIWLIGADNLRDFHLWRDWRRLAELIPIAVFNRPGYRKDALASKAAKAFAHYRIDEEAANSLAETPPPAWVFINETNIPVSSTELRKTAAKRTASHT